MISEYTYEQVKEHVVCRELDKIRVKGKSEAVGIYELITTKTELSAGLTEKLNTYSSALQMYRDKKFEMAKIEFEKLTEDAPSKIMAERCANFILKPPMVNWDGIWNFEVK